MSSSRPPFTSSYPLFESCFTTFTPARVLDTALSDYYYKIVVNYYTLSESSLTFKRLDIFEDSSRLKSMRSGTNSSSLSIPCSLLLRDSSTSSSVWDRFLRTLRVSYLLASCALAASSISYYFRFCSSLSRFLACGVFVLIMLSLSDDEDESSSCSSSVLIFRSSRIS